MSSYGKRGRHILDVRVYTEQSTDGGRPPGRSRLRVEINGLEADLTLHRPRSWSHWKQWSVSRGNGFMLSTPLFFLDVGTQWAHVLPELVVSGDFGEEWWAEKRWAQ